MKQNGMYWHFFSPMIKSSIRKCYGRELADRAVKKGRLEYRRLVENAPELGKGNPNFPDLRYSINGQPRDIWIF